MSVGRREVILLVALGVIVAWSKPGALQTLLPWYSGGRNYLMEH